MGDMSIELDQILVPAAGDTYEPRPLVLLLGLNRELLRSYSGFGLAPLHFITQRGPFQDGETPLDLRHDPRPVQLVIADTLACRSGFWDRRHDLLDNLRPARAFGATVRPHIYRKWLPDGHIERGSDMVVTNGSPTVTSQRGRFIDRGGLDAGCTIAIAGVTYTIAAVPNDYTLTLTANYAAGTATGVAWSYRRRWAKRDLYFLIEAGPSFDEGPGSPPAYPQGYHEVLRGVAHDPAWYGPDQYEEWAVSDALGNLVFDGLGAWFGAIAGVGRWLFAATMVGETVDVVYWGTDDAHPLIEIDGPAENPQVQNTTLGQIITMAYTAAAGETITIDTLNQTAYNNLGADLAAYVGGDVSTFALSPDPQAPEGINSVFVSFSSGVAGTSAARLRWRNRYIGI